MTQTISNDSFAHSQYNKAIENSGKGNAVISIKELTGDSPDLNTPSAFSGLGDVATTPIVPKVPGCMEKKNFSDPTDRKSPGRQRNKDD